MNSYVNTHRKPSTYQRHPSGANSMSLVTGLLPFTSEMALFEFPFNELLVSELKITAVKRITNTRPQTLDMGCSNETSGNGAANVGTW